MSGLVYRGGSLTFNGRRIIESALIEPVPRMQCSKRFREVQSPELVAKTNQWMLEFFGTQLPVYLIGKQIVVMHPSHVAMLRMEAKKEL